MASEFQGELARDCLSESSGLLDGSVLLECVPLPAGNNHRHLHFKHDAYSDENRSEDNLEIFQVLWADLQLLLHHQLHMCD